MSDIVERLRARKEPTIEVDMHYPQIVDSDTPDAECLEAAAEIDRLRSDLSAAEGVITRLNSGAELQTLMAENERLREVLKRVLEEDADGHVKWQTRKDARAALGEKA